MKMKEVVYQLCAYYTNIYVQTTYLALRRHNKQRKNQTLTQIHRKCYEFVFDGELFVLLLYVFVWLWICLYLKLSSNNRHT